MALSFPLIALLFLGTGVLGLILLRRGFRGRRVGDHPVCRKCGFDLFGLPEDRKVCPECGADLGARNAILIGHKQRRPALIYTGGALVVLFICVAALVGTAIFREVDWQRVKPVAWLAYDARHGDTLAWVELTRRAQTGAISAEQGTALTTDALAWQKDLSRVWKTQVGDFVETARKADLITDEQWKTYALQAPQLSLRFRDKVRKGDRVPCDLVYGLARAGSMSKLSLRLEKPIDADDPVFLHPKPREGGGGYSQSSLSGAGTSSLHLQIDRKAMEAAPLGKRTTSIKLNAEVREEWDKPGFPWEGTLKGDWELVGKDEPTVEIVPDDSPELRKQIEAALQLDKLQVRPRYPRETGANVELDLKIAALPVPLSYDVFLRGPTREWKLTTIAVAGATHYGTGGWINDKDHFDANRVDIVFRPSPEAARNHVSITRMWNGEITIHDAPVTWPATQPTTK